MPRAAHWLLALALGVAAACDTEAPAVDSDRAELAPWPYWRRTYFVAVPDLRQCPSPACGGIFVRAVNAATTPCWDGVGAEQCYVLDLDLRGSGLPDPTQQKIRDAIAARPDVREAAVVLRGSIGPSALPEYGALHVDAAWIGGTGDPGAPAHSPRYYQIVDCAPALVVRRPGVLEPDHAVSAFDPPAVGDFVTGSRDEELFDIDARFVRMR